MTFSGFLFCMEQQQKSFLKKIVPFTAFLGGLCCFTPVILVLLGLSSVTFATSLSQTLYGSYRWLFRAVAFLFLLAAVGWYLYRKEEICTLNKFKQKKRKVINLVLFSLVASILAYIIWLYVIVEIIGAALNIWG